MDKYISCKETLDAVKSLPGTIPSGDPVIDVIYKTITSRLVDLVSKISPADVAPVVHGRWIRGKHNGFNTLTCSACNTEYMEPFDLGAEDFSNYCSNCGSKMDLEVK